MRGILLNGTLPLLVVASLSAATPVHACAFQASFKIEHIKRADAVFTGRLIRYENVTPEELPARLYTRDYGLLTVRIDEVLKGDVSGDVQLYWWNSTFALPDKMEDEGPFLIAATEADRGSRLAEMIDRAPGRNEPLEVLQSDCSSPFILPNSQAIEQYVRTLLRGGAVVPFGYFIGLQQIREDGPPRTNVPAGSVIAASLAAILLGPLRYRRRKRAPSAEQRDA